jgi:antitoxin component YwqK of YwqJK toxin-antitoxin module
MKTPLTFLLSLTFLFLFSGSVYGQEEVKKEYWDNGNLKSEIHYKDGKPEGLATWWYETGEKKSETQYKRGIQDGLEIEWYKSGQKKSKTQYKSGTQNGLEIEWYKSGKKKSETHYKNGFKDRLEIEWYDSNQKKNETTYKNNHKDGLKIEWYKSGKKKSETQYKSDIQDGLKSEWYKSGKKKSETHYKIGRKVSEVEWYESGENKKRQTLRDSLNKLNKKGQILKDKFITLLDKKISRNGKTLKDGLRVFNLKNYKKAFEIFKPLAEQDDDVAQFHLGIMYANGYDLDKDLKQAFAWQLKAAIQGNKEAGAELSHLKVILKNEGLGEYNNKNYKKAFGIFKPLAEQDDDVAQFHLGIMYVNGYGVDKDLKQAFAWQLKAAKQGNKGAESSLSNITDILLNYGLDAFKNKNYKKAFEYLKPLAEKGDARAKSIVEKLGALDKCQIEIDSLKRLTCYDNLPMDLNNQKCSSEKVSLKKLNCYDQTFVLKICSREKDTLKRLTCYDNLPDNLKIKNCFSISDSLERLICFDN